ncbi:hypothetical protein C8Q80DRAFT_605579 [Daedaleopsis nitida]|nr:hypothetical protein C8Q80DRAFT_605579 [Daedaleopsis nitida]
MRTAGGASRSGSSHPSAPSRLKRHRARRDLQPHPEACEPPPLAASTPLAPYTSEAAQRTGSTSVSRLTVLVEPAARGSAQRTLLTHMRMRTHSQSNVDAQYPISNVQRPTAAGAAWARSAPPSRHPPPPSPPAEDTTRDRGCTCMHMCAVPSPDGVIGMRTVLPAPGDHRVSIRTRAEPVSIRNGTCIGHPVGSWPGEARDELGRAVGRRLIAAPGICQYAASICYFPAGPDVRARRPPPDRPTDDGRWEHTDRPANLSHCAYACRRSPAST